MQKTKKGITALRKETLRLLDPSELQRVAGQIRIRIPGGYADDTTPVYAEETGTP
jgi:hypothetical protein